MNTRTKAVTPATPFADVQRQQAIVAGEAAGILFGGAEAIRKIQERSAHEAVARHSAAAGAYTSAADPAQLLLAQAKLMREDLDAAAKSWQEIAAAALEMQFEIAACCTHLVESETALEAVASLGP